MARRTYSKPDTLEHIFSSKYDPDVPQDEIPFTRQEVYDAILATGGDVPLNLNNFVKDLVRTGNDAINLNQIVGIAAATLQRLMENDMPGVIPIGVKILSDGDICIVAFPMCTIADLLILKSKLTATSVTRQARYRLSPKPPKW